MGFVGSTYEMRLSTPRCESRHNWVCQDLKAEGLPGEVAPAHCLLGENKLKLVGICDASEETCMGRQSAAFEITSLTRSFSILRYSSSLVFKASCFDFKLSAHAETFIKL